MDNKYASIFFEVLSVLFLIISLFPLLKFGSLDGVPVPQHYNAEGYVNIWSTRESFLLMALISIVLYSFFSFCQSHPKMVNIPVRKDESNSDQDRFAGFIAQLLKVWSMALLSNISISTYRIAIGKAQCLNKTVEWIIICCALVHFALYFMLRKTE